MDDFTEDAKPLLNVNNDDIEIGHHSVTLSVSLDFTFLKSPRAPLMVFNVLFLFLGWCFCAAYKSGSHNYDGDAVSIYPCASIYPLVYQILLFVIFITGTVKRYDLKWNWYFHVFLFFACLLWASLLLISSRLIAYAANDDRDRDLQAAASFGFLACICFIGESQLNLLEWYRSKEN